MMLKRTIILVKDLKGLLMSSLGGPNHFSSYKLISNCFTKKTNPSSGSGLSRRGGACPNFLNNSNADILPLAFVNGKVSLASSGEFFECASLVRWVL